MWTNSSDALAALRPAVSEADPHYEGLILKNVQGCMVPQQALYLRVGAESLP